MNNIDSKYKTFSIVFLLSRFGKLAIQKESVTAANLIPTGKGGGGWIRFQQQSNCRWSSLKILFIQHIGNNIVQCVVKIKIGICKK